MYLLLLLQISGISFIHAWNHTLLERRPDLEAAAAGGEAQSRFAEAPPTKGHSCFMGRVHFAARWATTLQWNE